MKKTFTVAFAAILFYAADIHAQSLSINNTGAAANNSSILDVQSTTKGFLLPRMTKAQKNAIATPATGLLVYQTAPDSLGFHYYTGTAWVWLDPMVTNAWGVNGNSGTSVTNNFIGTTDDIPLHFRINNERSGRIESDLLTANTFLGYRSGRVNIGSFNTAFGNRVMASNTTGSFNSSFGSFSLSSNTTGSYNVGFGLQTLTDNTTGFGNTAIGSSSLESNTTGYVNTATGYLSMQSNTTGYANTATGNASLASNTTGNANAAFGASSLASNTTGFGNAAFGASSLDVNTTGLGNTATGFSAMTNNISGNYNTAIGHTALFNNTSGDLNIGIGVNALFTNTNKNNLIAIGSSALYSNGLNTSSPLQAIENIAIGNNALYDNRRGSNNVALGNNAASTDTAQIHNVAVGNSAMQQSIGNRNTALGSSALFNNRGNSNVAIGDSAMINTSQSFNTAIGAESLKNSTGRSNTAIGYRSLLRNITGNNNVAIGDSAAFNYTGSGIVAVGSQALFSNTTGIDNVALGAYSLRSNTTGNFNVGLGTTTLASNTVGSANIAIGGGALQLNISGSSNTAIGSLALGSNNNGDNNTAFGYLSLGQNTNGNGNTAIGAFSMQYRTGTNNLAIGFNAGGKSAGPVTTFTNNIFIGNNSGINSIGSNNVFIGQDVGNGFTQSNILAIDNSSTATPLIFGNFATQLLRINGTLNINNQYSFPLADGTTNQYLRTNGAGVTSWQTIAGESTTANNGLTLTGSNLQLGGVLVSNTAISHGTSNLIFDLSSSGNFAITKSGLPSFVARSNGNIGVNVANPLYSFHVVNMNGADGPFGRGVIIENTSSPTTGEASIAFKNRGTDGLPAYAAWMSGINNFTNFVVAYGDSLKGQNVKFKIDTFGNVSVNTKANAAQSRLDVNGSFGNGTALITADYTAGDDDHTIIIAASVNATPLTITLPGAGSCPRREYVIVNRNSSTKTITAYNDFSGTSTTIPANGSITLQSVSGGWFRIR